MSLKNNLIKYNIIQLKEAKLRAKIDKLEARRRKLNNVSWVDTLLKPLAKELAAALGKKHWEILGPFGLNCETSIWVFNTKAEREALHINSLTVTPAMWDEENPFGITVRIYPKEDIEYPKGSVGDLRRYEANYVIPPIDAELEYFVNLMKKDLDRK